MRPSTVTVTGTGNSTPLPVDRYVPNDSYGLVLNGTGAGAGTATVQYTYDDVFNPAVTPNWFSTQTPANLVGAAAGSIQENSFQSGPVSAFRISAAGAGAGDIWSLTVTQQGTR